MAAIHQLLNMYNHTYYPLLMHCSSGLLHNLTAPPLIGPLTVRLTSPEDGHITRLRYHHLPQGSLVNGLSTPNVGPQGSRQGRGIRDQT